MPDPVPLEIAARGWQAIVDPGAANWQLHAAMRTLAAATRGGGNKLSKDLATGVEIVLDRAGQVNPLVASGVLDAAVCRTGLQLWALGICSKKHYLRHPVGISTGSACQC